MEKPILVLTNGVFDILHRGHLHLLREAKKLGDILIVAIDSHERVEKMKPGRPINDQQTRVEMLEALRWVDKVIVFDSEITEVVKMLKPDILVKGGDYIVDEVLGKDVVEEYGGKVVIIPLQSGFSTGRIITKVRESLENFPASLVEFKEKKSREGLE